ncbi:MAG TPA: uracil-DNA glycosylase [Burkholderiales bacterium]|jgi:uracil-DNA glycosylase family 4|nr:uracil-DNA glycosylase [Burkholderiales bacterium]
MSFNSSPAASAVYDAGCRDCPRLAGFLDRVKAANPTYFCKPVPPFGAADAPLVIVGLAPGMHGANRTGRPFTGDYAGYLLYDTLRKYGFARGSFSPDGDDDLELTGCRISNAVKCLPPDNKPEPSEIKVCNHYLGADLAQPGAKVLLALGTIAHGAILTALGMKKSAFGFKHGVAYPLSGGVHLLDSYHCSRYNTNTRRLTTEMFETVFARARELVDA